MQVETILFDCDNTLAESEKLAFIACCAVVNEALSERGIARCFTPAELMKTFVGRTFRDMITELGTEHGFVLSAAELNTLAKREEDRVTETLAAHVEACRGVNAVLADVFGRFQIAVVSSSALRRVRACLKKTGQEQYFQYEHVFSATNSLPKPLGKPDPAIYHHSLEVLGAAAERSLAIEDSVSGGKAATAAGVPWIGYVGSYPACERVEKAEALMRAGALCVMAEWSEFPAILEELLHCDCKE
jgi:beta-phosphoglucomutase-like phosphatase (HAD superfamily)